MTSAHTSSGCLEWCCCYCTVCTQHLSAQKQSRYRAGGTVRRAKWSGVERPSGDPRVGRTRHCVRHTTPSFAAVVHRDNLTAGGLWILLSSAPPSQALRTLSIPRCSPRRGLRQEDAPRSQSPAHCNTAVCDWPSILASWLGRRERCGVAWHLGESARAKLKSSLNRHLQGVRAGAVPHLAPHAGRGLFMWCRIASCAVP